MQRLDDCFKKRVTVTDYRTLIAPDILKESINKESIIQQREQSVYTNNKENIVFSRDFTRLVRRKARNVMAAIIVKATLCTASNRYSTVPRDSLMDAFAPRSISVAVSCVIKARSREFSFSRGQPELYERQRRSVNFLQDCGPAPSRKGC